MSYLSERVEEDYDGLLAELELKLSSYIPPQNNPDEGVPAETLMYFPYNFPNKWPLLAAAELPPEGGTPASASDTKATLRAIRLGVRIYYPSRIMPERAVRGEPEYRDARESAKRVTRAVWSNWLKAFQADTELRAWTDNNKSIGSIEMGDENRVGNPFYQPGTAGKSILWIHSTEVILGL